MCGSGWFVLMLCVCVQLVVSLRLIVWLCCENVCYLLFSLMLQNFVCMLWQIVLLSELLVLGVIGLLLLFMMWLVLYLVRQFEKWLQNMLMLLWFGLFVQCSDRLVDMVFFFDVFGLLIRNWLVVLCGLFEYSLQKVGVCLVQVMFVVIDQIGVSVNSVLVDRLFVLKLCGCVFVNFLMLVGLGLIFICLKWLLRFSFSVGIICYFLRLNSVMLLVCVDGMSILLLSVENVFWLNCMLIVFLNGLIL